MTDPATRGLDGINALLRIEREARQARSLRELGFVMVNRGFEVLPFALAAFWRPRSRKRVRIEAVSGAATLDRSAPQVVALERVAGMLARKTEYRSARIVSADDLPAAETKAWRQWSPPHVLWCPLVAPSGALLGGLWLGRDQAWQAGDVAMAAHVGGTFAHAMAALGGAKRPGRSLADAPTLAKAALAAFVVAGLALIRVDLTALAPATVIPVEPAIIAAPTAGVVQAIDVAPNQPVKAGQILFRLDQTEARNGLEAALQALNVAEAERLKARQKAFSDPESKARLALLDAQIQEATAEIAYARDVLGRTVATAPRDGIAIFADANDWLGRPVATGEKVMTIADPAKSELEILLPVDDAFNLTPGARVTVYLNIAPLDSREAVLRYAAYEAAPTPQGVLAYRLKAAFADAGPPLRIGLKGTAKVFGGKVSLFYFLFRRPLAALRQSLGL